MNKVLHKRRLFSSDTILIAVIILIGLFALRHTFSFSLFGDDWLALYRYRYHVGEWSTGQYNLLSYFLTPYGAQDIAMGILAKIFGYTSLPFYIISFSLRAGVSIALYLIVKWLTNNPIAAFISGLFFIVSSIGLDATNWVFNMPSYTSLISIAFFIFFFLKSQSKRKLRYAVYAAVFYYLAFLFAPIRIHGLPLLAISLEAYFLVQLLLTSQLKKIELKIIFLRQLIMIGVLPAIFLTGPSGGIKSDIVQKLGEGFAFMANSIRDGNLTFLFHPFIIFGRFFFPETFLSDAAKFLFGSSTPRPFIISAILFSPFIYLMVIIKQRGKNSILLASLSLIALWAILVRTILLKNLNYLDPISAIPAYLGGYLFIFWIYLLIINIRELSSNLLFVSIVWSILSFIFPWLWTPNSLFGTTHRYFIMSGIGISLFCGTLALNLTSKKSRWITISILALLFFVQLNTSNNYLSYLAKVRNETLNDKIWATLSQVEAVGKNENPIIFYFEGENSATLYYLATFGFPPHVGVLYNIRDLSKLPVPLDRWEDAVKAVTTGANLPAYGYKAEPNSINNFYSFKILDNGNVINTTASKRKELSIELRKFKFLNR